MGLHCGIVDGNPPANVRDMGSIPRKIPQAAERLSPQPQLLKPARLEPVLHN